MSLRFTLAMSLREVRSTRRRLFVYMTSVAVGVAALVAIQSFRSAVSASIDAQSRALLGADLELESRSALGPELAPALADLQRSGSAPAYVTRFTSMALAQPSGRTRLVWVHALDGAYPYYGEIETEPPGLWQSFRSSAEVLVDPAVLIQLDAAVGDELVIGEVRFRIAGTVRKFPGSSGMRDQLAPRIYMPAAYLDQTRLLRAGSLATYAAYFRIERPQQLSAALAEHGELLRRQRVRHQTADEYAAQLSANLGWLSRFLGLIGLCALLLGGVGVATGVHVFVVDKLASAAVLRCLGARQRDVFAIYLLQAAALGLLGGALGTALGVAVQVLLPRAARDLLPLEIAFRFDAVAVGTGLVLGLWVTLLFALLPLLEIRGVTPLRALRRDVAESAPRADPWRRVVLGCMAVSVAALTVWQAPSLRVGLYFSAGLLCGLLALALAAAGFMAALRRYFPRRAPFWLRQGVANLFRPQNQTLAVTFALGLGVFLLASLHIAQRSLLQRLEVQGGPDRPNLAVFDIQLDQRDDVVAQLRERGARILEQTPIVPARIGAVRGVEVAGGSPGSLGERGRRWALRREYRLSYRSELRDTERITAGRWWDGPAAAGALPRVSLEQELATELGVAVGDRIDWDVQGVRIATEVANLRSIDWARFATNFFAVFEPGALEQAPQSLVVLAQLEQPEARAAAQRDLVERFPNLSLIDATAMLEALDGVLGRVALAIRFMSLFAIASGLLILIGTLSTSRYQRVRETVLLRTLGAPALTVRCVLATEYLALGALAGAVGIALAAAASWGVMELLFELSPRLPLGDLAGLLGLSALSSAAIGLASSREALRRTPLAGIREVVEVH